MKECDVSSAYFLDNSTTSFITTLNGILEYSISYIASFNKAILILEILSISHPVFKFIVIKFIIS